MGVRGVLLVVGLAGVTGCVAFGASPLDEHQLGDSGQGSSSTSGTTGAPETTSISTTAAGDESDSSGGETGGDGESAGSSGGELPLPACGDGFVDPGEECDEGPANGAGSFCRLDCVVNTCPDGYVGPGETCDDGNFDDADECTSACGPATCGDGVVQQGNSEACDEGPANALDGACLPSCQLATCGDGNIHAGVEVCDGVDVQDHTCQDFGLTGGAVACAPGCTTLDLDGCFACGDGNVDPGEDCDSHNLQGASCSSIDDDFGGGEITCTEQCTYDTAECCIATGSPCTNNWDCCSGYCILGIQCAAA